MWWVSENPSTELSKASLGLFFFEVLNSGAQIGEIWPFNPSFDRSLVTVSIFMTEEQKAQIEDRTKFRFRRPPKISLVQYDENVEEKASDYKPYADIGLKHKGARWFHSDDHYSPSHTKAALGEFLYTTIKAKAQIGTVWLMKPKWETKGTVFFTVFMTEDMKNEIEAKTRFRFRDPPVSSLTEDF